MKILIFAVVLLCISTNAFALPSNKTESFANIYQVKLNKDDKVVRGQTRAFQMGLIVSKISKTQIVAQQFRPQSIHSARLRAKEVSVDPRNVRVLKSKTSSIFFFEDANFIYLYSTKGGRLLISKNKKEIFDINRVCFVQREVASL